MINHRGTEIRQNKIAMVEQVAANESMNEKGLLGSQLSMVEEPMMQKEPPKRDSIESKKQGEIKKAPPTFVGSPTKGEIEMEK